MKKIMNIVLTILILAVMLSLSVNAAATATLLEDVGVRENPEEERNLRSYNDELSLQLADGDSRWVFLKFDITGITGKDIISAKLIVNESPKFGEGTSGFDVYTSSSEWKETELCWAKLDTVSIGNDILGTIAGKSFTNSEVMECDLSASLFAEDGQYSFCLKGNASGDMTIADKEDTENSAFIAKLVIETVDKPTETQAPVAETQTPATETDTPEAIVNAPQTFDAFLITLSVLSLGAAALTKIINKPKN